MSNRPNPNLARTERASIRVRASLLASKLALAAVCMVPMADLALSDASVAKIYQTAQAEIRTGSSAGDQAVLDGIIAATVFTESIGLGLLITKTEKLKGAFDDLDDYTEAKRHTMSSPRRMASKVINAPYGLFAAIGRGFERLGEKLSERHSPVARALGRTAIDTGQVNAMGTSAVIMQETMAGTPPTTKRNLWLGGLITGSYLGGIEVLRGLYDLNVPLVRGAIGLASTALHELTDVNVAQPWSSPVATGFVGLATAGLAVSGWRIGEYHQQRAAEEALPAGRISSEVD